MKLLIVHFSDIHFQATDNSLMKKKDKLFNALKNKAKEADSCLIITSGDIAFSGLELEYKTAEIFYNELIKSIEEYSAKKCDVVFVPGNHDCLFDEKKKALRSLAIKNFENNGFENADEVILDTCCEPEENYFTFIDSFHQKNILKYNHKLLQRHEYDFHGCKVKVLGYNTSWFSQNPEMPGKMGFPFKMFQPDHEIGNSNLVISVLHHPYNWREPDNAREFRQHIERTTDFVLSGHEHSPTRGIYNNLEGNNTWYVEAPALQNNERVIESGYNLIEVDFNTRQVKIETWQWLEGIYKISTNTGWKDFLRGNNLKVRDININDDFLKYLTNPGAAYDYIGADEGEITLEKLFVCPNLKDVNPEKSSKKSDEFKNAKDVFSLNKQTSVRTMILGEDNAGKTAMCRYYYKKYYDDGYIPILLKGENIRGINNDQIQKSINDAFKEQYHENEIDNFDQLDKNSVVIFIDNFHQFKNKKEYKEILIKNLLNNYDNIIITGNKLMQYEDYTNKGGGSIYEEFEQYQILECGPELRYQIINKWNYLGSDYFTDKNELLKKNDKAAEFVNNIVRKNLIPAYPFFILTMLQALDGTDVAPQYSMHGYYYQLLIDKAIAHAVKETKEIGFYHTFITKYCYFLFDNKIRFRGMAISGFKDFFNDHCRKFGIDTISFERGVKILQSAKLINVVQDEVRIAYKYVYYYYVAKFLSENINNSDIMEKIRLMCERVYREEYANVVMFLVHLEKSRFILDELLANSRKIFADVQYVKLEEDVKFINEMVDKIPTEIMENYEVDDARKNERAEEERQEILEKKYEEEELSVGDYDLTEDLSKIDIISNLNKAVKTIEILGQVTKKHWGEIEKDKKFDLTEETFLLGLRTLGYYFEILKSNTEVLIEHIRYIIAKKHLRDKLDIRALEEISKAFLFKLCSFASFGIVKRISNAIGLEELSSTFKQVESKYKCKSVELINASIQLDHFKGFPEDSLVKIKEDNASNYLVASILQNLLINYMYLYHTDEERKQRLFSKFGISMPTQRMIEATSPVRKTAI